MNSNRKAFLDMLAVSEGTSTSEATKCDGYDIIVVGIDGVWELITDFSTHPFANNLRQSKAINNLGLISSASGRYQFMKKDWNHYRILLNLDDKTLYPDGAFSPKAQDAWAIQLIKECGALPAIDTGCFDEAVHLCRKIWASLPGAGYGQHENALSKLQAAYINAGGLFAEAAIDTPAIPIPAVRGITFWLQLIGKLIAFLFRKKP
jgi:muramidase (phage lysozyme)